MPLLDPPMHTPESTSRSLHWTRLCPALAQEQTFLSLYLGPCTEPGGVLPLFKTLTNTPEPISHSLHWTSLGQALAEATGKCSWVHISVTALNVQVLPLLDPWTHMPEPTSCSLHWTSAVKHLIYQLANTPDSTSLSLHWTSLGPARVRSPNK